jgi:hypothetical protein
MRPPEKILADWNAWLADGSPAPDCDLAIEVAAALQVTIAELTELKAILADPCAVWANMLRQTIAWPSSLDDRGQLKTVVELTGERDAAVERAEKAERAAAQMRDDMGMSEPWPVVVELTGERDAAVERAEKAERAAAQMRDDMGMSEPWPVVEVLRKLSDAAEHLLHDHDCDHQGHEGISDAKTRARQLAARLESCDPGKGSVREDFGANIIGALLAKAPTQTKK